MDEIIKAISELVRQGRPVADNLVSMLYVTRIADSLVGLGQCLALVGGACWITRAILRAIRQYQETERSH